MRRILLAFSMLALFACTKDLTEVPTPTPQDLGENVVGLPAVAAKGVLAVKLTPEAATRAMEVQTRSGETATRSGIEDIDLLFDKAGVVSFERIFAYDAHWEARYKALGLDRWYAVKFDTNTDLADLAKNLGAVKGVSTVDMPINPKYRQSTSTDPVRPMVAEDVLNPQMLTRSKDAISNDPLVRNQWHYCNYGDYVQPDGKKFSAVAGADVGLADAWQMCKGETNGQDIIVAVLDQPVYTEHPDLKANLWCDPQNPDIHGYNFWNNQQKLDWKSKDPKGSVADHGTHVAGTIAAVSNNSLGVAGIAGGSGNGGNVKIMSCQILGYGGDPDKEDEVDPFADSKAFEYAWKHGAIIAQNSWGYNFGGAVTPEQVEKIWNERLDESMALLQDAMAAFIELAGSDNPNSPLKGGLILFSAGNSGFINDGGKSYPAAHVPCISVSAMDWTYNPSYYTDYGTWTDVTAPGGDYMCAPRYNNAEILSSVLCDDSMTYPDGRKDDAKYYGYGWMQGTSMACPHASGVAALGLAYAAKLGKQFTADEYRNLYLSSVRGIDHKFSGVKEFSMAGTTYTLDMADYVGKMGGGLIDATKLLLNIKGVPAVYVETKKSVTIDLKKYLGDAYSKVALVSYEANGLDKLGVDAKPEVVDGKITLTPSLEGAATLVIKATAGDTEITREVAVVSRLVLAQNGGWL